MEDLRAHSLRAQLIALALLLAPAVFAHQVSLKDAKLYQLTRFQRFEFSSLGGKRFLTVFFQNDCPPCREQMKALKCLKEKMPQVEVVAVGVGDPKELTKEVKRLQLNFPAVESTPSFLELVEGISSTPVTLFADEKGMVTQRENGTRTCEEWEKLAKLRKW